MRSIWVIMSKELKIYFTTWSAYVFWAVLVIFSAYVFLVRLADFQEQSIRFAQMNAAHLLDYLNLTDMVFSPLVAQTAVLMLLIIPLLTMHLIAGEHQSKTIELLMTVPVRPVEIVLGKFFAALIMILVAIAVLVFFPVLLDQYGVTSSGDSAIDWKTVLSGFLGLGFFCAAAVAIGLFWSSLTRSPIVAGFGSFITLLMLWVLSWRATGESTLWAAVLDYISITTHLEAFVRGVIRLGDIVYYSSLALLALFLSHRLLEAHRWK